MQKLLSRPVATPFFFIFGLVLSQIGYAGLHRGSFMYKPQQGVRRVISPASDPTFYWLGTAGVLILGVVCFAISAYSAVCLVRAYRGEGARQFRPNPFALVMVGVAAIFMLFALFAGTCSHR